MSNLGLEREHLITANRNITDGERRISAQALLTERLRSAGHETTDAELLLQTLQETLETWRRHRDLIVQEIARLERPQSH